MKLLGFAIPVWIVVLLVAAGVGDFTLSCWPVNRDTPVTQVKFFQVTGGQEIPAEISLGSKQTPQQISFKLGVSHLNDVIDSVTAIVYLTSDTSSPVGTYQLHDGQQTVTSVSPELLRVVKSGYANVVIVFSAIKPTSVDHAIENVTQEMIGSVIGTILGRNISEPQYYWIETSGGGIAAQSVPARLIFGKTEVTSRVISRNPLGFYLTVNSPSTWVGIGCRTGSDFGDDPDKTGSTTDFQSQGKPPQVFFVPLSGIPLDRRVHPYCRISDAAGKETTYTFWAETRSDTTGKFLQQHDDWGRVGPTFTKTVDPPPRPELPEISVYGQSE